MKNYLLIMVLVFAFSCKNKGQIKEGESSISVAPEINDCLVIDELQLKDNQFKVEAGGFNIIFNNVLSTDDPNLDFELKSKGKEITIQKKYLESDFLGDNDFFIESNSIDSIKVKYVVQSDFVFYGQEKKRTPLNMSSSKEHNLYCNEGVYRLDKNNLVVNPEVFTKAKAVNKSFYLSVLESDSYGEIDKTNAKEVLKKLNENIEMSLEDLFVESSILKITYQFDYYIGDSKEEIKLIVIN
ncbi:hypothetical protein KO493_08740 [Tamlana agarivorans]|uniref:Uncharacterized protein n=1 Tax=Pseudotamlana agarivorans TaxID=481183 RepID=A0ACC5U8X9_9FLAO|nr:hypothetical protein [Tamlana agarivorans]MBU2950782.1 hypothetical protein [Tamlana agarivorans]